ncbi:MAG: hypothetical protein M3256_12935 [Actinomycetota bacterium]|nr:hypothetical protein [Actinomycetota bacterium]
MPSPSTEKESIVAHREDLRRGSPGRATHAYAPFNPPPNSWQRRVRPWPDGRISALIMSEEVKRHGRF